MGSFLDKPITEKHSSVTLGELDGKRLWHAVSSMQGWRVSMEDSHIHEIGIGGYEELSAFGVFDGHGGAMTANYLEANLLKDLCASPLFSSLKGVSGESNANELGEVLRQGFISIDATLRTIEVVRCNQDNSGSTGVMCMVTPTHYIVANCGDSRLLICSKKEVKLATADHKPSNVEERERIENAGGKVSFNRVSGDLAVSRAFGDFVYKGNAELPAEKQMVSPEPDISILKRDFESDHFIVVACDGIWDVMTNDAVRVFVVEEMARGYPLDYICECLIDKCLNLNSRDNMSVIIVALPASPDSIGSLERP